MAFRSGLEEAVAAQLDEAGVDYCYEEMVVHFHVEKESRYTPDFVLSNGIIIESKGRFKTEDRQKHLRIQAQYPQLDIRFVFSNANERISKKSKTTYAVWCQTHGFKYSSRGRVPEEWLKEDK